MYDLRIVLTVVVSPAELSESEGAAVSPEVDASRGGTKAEGGWWDRFVVDKLRVFVQPSILLLLLGASMRHTGDSSSPQPDTSVSQFRH